MLKKLNVYLGFIVLIFINTNCVSSFRESAEAYYLKDKKNYSFEQIDHFPEELPMGYLGGHISSPTELADSCFGFTKFVMYAKYTFNDYFQQKAHLNAISKEVIQPNGINILLLFPYCDKLIVEGVLFDNQETKENKLLAKHNTTTATSLPIPLFGIDEYRGSTIYGLSKDFVVYVLGAKPGRFQEEEFLEDCECLPEKWKHGYSKGVAMSDKRQVIIYWVAVW